MTVERFNLDGNPGDTLTAGNSGADFISIGAGASLKFDNSQMAHGTTSAALKGGASGSTTFLQFARTGTQIAVVIYWNPGSALPAAIVRLVDIRNSAGTIVRLQTTAANKFAVQEGGGSTTLYTMPTVFAVNTWYRLELVLSTISTTAGAYKFAYYLDDAGSPVDAEINKTTGNVGSTAIAKISVGSGASTTWTGTAYYDDVALNVGSAAYIGALPPTGVTYNAAPCDSSGDVFPAQTSYTYSASADSGGDVAGGSGTPTPPSATYQASPCDSSADIYPGSWSAQGNVVIVIPPNLPGTTETVEITGEATVVATDVSVT